MAKQLFKIIKPGISTTFQDFGRTGYEAYGIPVSGAMDKYSLQIGNLLVGNRKDEAALEVIMGGLELHVLATHTIAITGGDLDARLNGVSVPLWKSFQVNKGDRLILLGPKKGMVAYICVAAGYKIEKSLGSKSTYIKANIGHNLSRNDILYANESNAYVKQSNIGLKKEYLPSFAEKEIHVIIGPDYNKFANKDILFSQPYILKQYSRMGMILEGREPLRYEEKSDIVSASVPLGTIQIPANGQPIVLMNDRQTTGGYGMIAIVSTVDSRKIAQMAPGTKLRFKEISIEEGQRQIREEAKLISYIEMELNKR